jgi:hypothetical protein
MTIRPWKVIESTHPRKHLRVDRCELPNGNISTLFYALAHLQLIG